MVDEMTELERLQAEVEDLKKITDRDAQIKYIKEHSYYTDVWGLDAHRLKLHYHETIDSKYDTRINELIKQNSLAWELENIKIVEKPIEYLLEKIENLENRVQELEENR